MKHAFGAFEGKELRCFQTQAKAACAYCEGYDQRTLENIRYLTIDLIGRTDPS